MKNDEHAPSDSSASYVASVYDECAEEYTSTFFNEETVAIDVPFLRKLHEAATPCRFVLDVGCGPGMHAAFFVSMRCRYLGCDISPRMLRIARQRNPKCDFCEANALALPVEEKSVDALLALESLVHMDETEFRAALREVRRILRPGGVMLLALQHGDGFVEVNYPLGPSRKVMLRLDNERRIEPVLSRLGFNLLHCERRAALPSEIDLDKLVVIARRAP